MIRPARPSDRPHLVRLQAHLRDPSPELLGAALEGVGILLVSTDGPDGPPVGYVLAIPGSDGVHAAELVVDPAVRRQGRGSALLQRVHERFEGPTTLAVAPDNDPARRCYESLGFRVRERVDDYYDGDPALIMVRS